LHGAVSNKKNNIWGKKKIVGPPLPLGVVFLVFSGKQEKARKLMGHLGRKISASVDGGLSGGPSKRRPGSEGPHRCLRNLITYLLTFFLTYLLTYLLAYILTYLLTLAISRVAFAPKNG
jgi:hypothetical protein